MESKIYKAGTKVRFKYLCAYSSEESEEHVLQKDMSKQELEDMAYEIAVEQTQPEGWFVLADEDEEE